MSNLPIDGLPAFQQLRAELILGKDRAAVKDGRVVIVQALSVRLPGGPHQRSAASASTHTIGTAVSLRGTRRPAIAQQRGSTV